MSNSPPEGKPGVLSRIWALAPFRTWLMLAAVIGGIAGLGIFTFVYAQGASYLSDDPSSCVNCHVMRDQYDGWNHGSHKAVATCNDCHVPEGFVAKWIAKGEHGPKDWHSGWCNLMLPNGRAVSVQTSEQEKVEQNKE